MPKANTRSKSKPVAGQDGSSRPIVRPAGLEGAEIGAPVTSDGIEYAGTSSILSAALSFWAEASAYQIDWLQRAVLLLDALRERGDNMLAHERAGLPPLLAFPYDVVLDARGFEHPANYALVRILPRGDPCLEACAREDARPVIVFDPRAGHGPGIGGFKHDSEVGIAMHEGHPVYFVMFFPQPCDRQTLADVHHALRRFVAEVARRHPGKPPVLYGNCQAGWAVTLLSADCAGMAGPAVLNGSPLSYWAGEKGVNPMRLAGGLSGGTWSVRLLADLGAGRFDGAWLVQNFENLNPGNALFDKYYQLFASIDTERERFLEFERWWSGFYFLSREEITAIVENLFIGNRLEEGQMRICEHCFADLRRIANPILVFASSGDNITPPHQALGWIPAIYADTEALKAAGQRIVYLINPHVGHLGIFVSSAVARREHRAILERVGDLEALRPGLYEMRIVAPTGNSDCREDQYEVCFEPRRVEDLRHPYPKHAFSRVREMSEQMDSLYARTLGPWARSWSNPTFAAWLKWTHPMRATRYLLSREFNPWAPVWDYWSAYAREARRPVTTDNVFATIERAWAQSVSHSFGVWRDARDAGTEALFEGLYVR